MENKLYAPVYQPIPYAVLGSLSNPLSGKKLIGELYFITDFIEMVKNRSIMASDGVIGHVIIGEEITDLIVLRWSFLSEIDYPEKRTEVTLSALLNYFIDTGTPVKIEWCNK